MALGPVVGGALVDSVGWRGIFWVNIPVGIAAIVLTALFVPESRAARHRRPVMHGSQQRQVSRGGRQRDVLGGKPERVIGSQCECAAGYPGQRPVG
ncbi:MAG: MFS transporter [Streptosporangiaceae bacterium]